MQFKRPYKGINVCRLLIFISLAAADAAAAAADAAAAAADAAGGADAAAVAAADGGLLNTIIYAHNDLMQTAAEASECLSIVALLLLLLGLIKAATVAAATAAAATAAPTAAATTTAVAAETAAPAPVATGAPVAATTTVAITAPEPAAPAIATATAAAGAAAGVWFVVCVSLCCFLLQLRVPRKSFARGELFELTTNYLKYKYSSTEVYDEPHPVAVEGDALLLQVFLLFYFIILFVLFIYLD